MAVYTIGLKYEKKDKGEKTYHKLFEVFISVNWLFSLLFLGVFAYQYFGGSYDVAVVSFDKHYFVYIKLSLLFSVVFVAIEEKNRKRDLLSEDER